MVCIEPFTKQPSRKQAKCPYCDVKACVGCTQTYLLGTTEDAHCMGCRKGWTRTVIDTILLTTWLNGTYKKHRENILLEREKSRLPSAQIILERQKEAEERLPILEHLQNERAKIYAQLQLAEEEIQNEHLRIFALRNGREPSGEKAEKRVFVMPCPVNDCRGFLSTAYKCGLCNVHCCSKCREVKNEGHECNPDTLKSVEEMKKKCRNCPECGASIFKIEGCNMMFCTACNTPFDWVSGEKIKHGRIHNPHYFAYIQRVGGPLRDPGDIPCGGRLPQAWQFDQKISKPFRRFQSQKGILSNEIKLKKDMKDRILKTSQKVNHLYNGLRTVEHVQDIEIRGNTVQAQDMDNTEYNVRYLKKEIDETRWKQLLQQKEKRRMKKDEIRQILEAFCATCVDIYAPLMELTKLNTQYSVVVPKDEEEFLKGIETAYEQMSNLCEIVNKGLMEVSRRYKCVILQIHNSTFNLEREKYIKEDGDAVSNA